METLAWIGFEVVVIMFMCLILLGTLCTMTLFYKFFDKVMYNWKNKH